jgi:N-acetylglucosamine kinase-like BadF-type ATPase
MGLIVFWLKPKTPLPRVVVMVYNHKPMSELIRNLVEAMEEMAKTGNEKGVIILENAIKQANKLITDKQVSG